uniref:ATP-binding cassette, sub-family A (ABC1), member 2 n=1 Tax=Sphaeramia orbicularis TaxID=375764 RepID=A0A672YKH9_9TELE
MGFLHQLHLLLWKNVSLKRRGPWVLAFEIFIPLVLFFILLGLRQKKPAIPVKEGRWVLLRPSGCSYCYHYNCLHGCCCLYC